MHKSICLISRYAHYVLLNQTQKRIGGAEFQEVIIAKALRDRGWQVSFITEKIGSGAPFTEDGIKLIAGMDFNKGNRYLRRILRLPIQLWKLMKVADAQVYYHRNPGPLSSIIGIFCRLKGRRFVLAGANDTNFHPGHELNVNSKLEILDIKYSIKLADIIILQSNRQRHLLNKYYGCEGIVFYNMYDPPSFSIPLTLRPIYNGKKKILWVGRLAGQKRPELCLKIAILLSEFEIVMVGARGREIEITDKVCQESKQIPNLSYVGHLSLPQVEDLFDNAHALINTSYVEGFPNTFLQAWSRGLPVFSFVDPDNLITTNDLGAIADSIEQMAEIIRKRLNDNVGYMCQARKIESFFKKYFTLSSRIKAFEKLLLLEKGRISGQGYSENEFISG